MMAASLTDRLPFNEHTALQRIGGDQRLLHDLAVFYVEDAPSLLATLREAVRNGDAEGVMHAAHVLKSLSSNLDAHQAVALAAVLESAGRSGDLKVATELVPELEASVSAVLKGLRSAYADLP